MDSIKSSLIDGRLQALGVMGEGLVRPECVLATRSGDIYTADWRGGVAHRLPSGHQTLYRADLPTGEALRPNGIALLADGSFLCAHLGEQTGGVWRLHRDGGLEPWLLRVEGQLLPPTNFVLPDEQGRVWVTVSTRRQPRALGYRALGGDGFIVCVGPTGTRIVADGLGYTNEVALHPTGRWLYVNETFAQRLSRFVVAPDGTLGERETVVQFGAGTFPDGLAFDEAGCTWVVSIVSNRLFRVTPDGQAELWIEDVDPDHLLWVQQAFERGTMDRPHLDRCGGRLLRNISSIAFSGADRRTALLGCLLGNCLGVLRLPSPGVAPVHWSYR